MKQSIEDLYSQSCKENWEKPRISAKECTDARQSLIKTCLK